MSVGVLKPTKYKHLSLNGIQNRRLFLFLGRVYHAFDMDSAKCQLGHADADRCYGCFGISIGIQVTMLISIELANDTEGLKWRKIYFLIHLQFQVTFYPLKLILFIHFIPFSFLYFILRFSHISYIS